MRYRLLLSSLIVAFAGTAMAADPIWKACRQAVYEPSETDETRLELSYNAELTYDNRGNVLEEVQDDAEGTRTRILRTYDSESRVLTEISETFVGGNWVKTRSKERAYDEQTGMIIFNGEYSYVDGTEYPGNCYRRLIERNADGNITLVEVSVFFNGDYDPTKRMIVTYDESTGLAVGISNLELMTSDGITYKWVTGETFTDIVWHKTNGQITSLDDLYRGDNLISSAHYENSNNGAPYHNYDISVTYGENGIDYTSVFTGLYQGVPNTGVQRVYSETITDDGGLYIDLWTSYYDLEDETIPSENYNDYAGYDAYGLQTIGGETYREGEDGEAELMYELFGQVTYDETYGYPLTYTLEEDGLQFKRVEFSQYIDCATIASLREFDKAAANAPQEWYDLSGRRISRPGSGICLMRRAGKTIKTVIR